MISWRNFYVLAAQFQADILATEPAKLRPGLMRRQCLGPVFQIQHPNPPARLPAMARDGSIRPGGVKITTRSPLILTLKNYLPW